MNPQPNLKHRVPIQFWESERAMHIPIEHLTPAQAALARWLKPIGRLGPRKPFVPLNRPVPV